MSGTLDDLLETLADAIIEAQPQCVTARRAGLTEKHVSQMLTGKVDGTLKAWQRMLTAAGLGVEVRACRALPYRHYWQADLCVGAIHEPETSEAASGVAEEVGNGR